MTAPALTDLVTPPLEARRVAATTGSGQVARCPDCGLRVKRSRETCRHCGAPLSFKAYKARADQAAERGLGLRAPSEYLQEARKAEGLTGKGTVT